MLASTRRPRTSFENSPRWAPRSTRKAQEGSIPLALQYSVSVLFCMMKPALTACSMSGTGRVDRDMDDRPTFEGDVRVNAASELSTAFAPLMPRSPGEVGLFLGQVAKALGLAQADLARQMGVSAPTLSSWKKRGVIPERYTCWFTQELVPLLMSGALTRKIHPTKIGTLVALTVLDQTEFDPLGGEYASQDKQIEACASIFPALCNLGDFVVARLSSIDLPLLHLRSEIAPTTALLAKLGIASAMDSAPIPWFLR